MINRDDIRVTRLQLDLMRRSIDKQDFAEARMHEKALMHAALETVKRHSTDEMAVAVATIALESFETEFPRWEGDR